MSKLQSIAQNRITLAVLAGAALACAFPKLSWAGLAWIAPSLLLVAGMAAQAKRRFFVGYIAGLVFYLPSLIWLWNIPYTGAPIAGWLALGSYMAIYPALWLWLAWKIFPDDLVLGDPKSVAILETRERFFRSSLLRRQGWALGCAAMWVALEMAQGRLLTGFPWFYLGVSQYQTLPLIQIASVVGVPGISFVMVWISVSLVSAMMRIFREPSKHWSWGMELALPAFVVVIVVGWGGLRLATPDKYDLEVSMALIQPSIPQTEKWDPEQSQVAFQRVLDLSKTALQLKPDILVWPEATLPKLVNYDRETYQAVTGIARDHDVWLITGADDVELVPGPEEDKPIFFNSVMLVTPEGKITTRYDKRRLVMFGEYVPLSEWFPFLAKLTPIEGGFQKGSEATKLVIPEHDLTTTALICFEDAFAPLARVGIDAQTDIILNVTNDGWFGEGAAQWQHAANATFRAVENQRTMIRCANNGLTCWIGPKGRLHEVWFGDSKDIYGAGFKMAHIPLPAADTDLPITFYTRLGDWFGWGCVLVSMVWIAAIWRRRPNEAPAETA